LLRETASIPVVFAFGDPIATGLIPSMAHPGGNVTGFMSDEPGIATKWLQLLKDFVPNARVASFGGTAMPGSPSDFGKLIAEETDKRAKVIRAVGIKPE
jgi:putative ABC transport system substrate-binding protein